MNVTIQRRIFNLMKPYVALNNEIHDTYTDERYVNKNIYYPIVYSFVVGNFINKEDFPYTAEILKNKKKKWMKKYLRRIEDYLKENEELLKALDEGYCNFNKL